MAAAQMNILMDSALKASGNAVIAELGYTPSRRSSCRRGGQRHSRPHV